MLKFPENSCSQNQLQIVTSSIMLNSELQMDENKNSLQDESSSDSDSPWEERYERMWVDQEKIKLKSHFKTITAELKQKFGEIIENPKILHYAKGTRQICLQESNMTSGVQPSVTSDGNAVEHAHNTANLTDGEYHLITPKSDLSMLDNRSAKLGSVDRTPPDISLIQTSSSTNIPDIGDSLNSSECMNTNKSKINCLNTLTQTQRNNTKLPKTSEMFERVSDRVTDLRRNAENLQNHSFMEDCLHKSVNNSEAAGFTSPNKRTQFSITVNNATEVKNLDCFKNSNTQDLVDDNLGKFKLGSDVENRPSQSSSEEAINTLLDKGLEQDVQRFKNEVGMLQAVFLNLEKEKAQLQKEVEEEKLKSTQSQKWDASEKVPAGIDDGDKRIVQNSTSYDKNQESKQTLCPKWNSLSENGGVVVQSANSFIPKEQLKVTQNLSKKKLMSPSDRENVKNGRKNHTKRSTKPTSARSLNHQPILAAYGNAHPGADDSTFSETSQDEERSNPKSGNEKEKVIRPADLADDLEDFTLSSDTATEECDPPTSAYRNAMQLIKQLSVEGQDSVSVLKFENIVHEYERLIEKENGRYRLLLEKIRTFESEKKALHKVIEETRELKSSLEHQKVEWESDLNSVRFTLKQEEEKRKSSEMLYDKCKDQLRKKEDQCCKEMEAKQQHELNMRNMELELRTLRNSLKQVEEERSEAQRLLSQERSARAVQEGILNKHLWKQKEEDEKKKMIAKRDECLPQMSDISHREKELSQRNHSLQGEINVLKTELDQLRAHKREEEVNILEENEMLKEKLEDLRRDLKLNEEALTQTVYQYTGQFNALKAESTILSSKIEHEKQSKERLETELESVRSRLASALQELERSQTSKSDAERTFQRERDDWLRSQDKVNYDLTSVRESNTTLSQQLSKAEAKANSLENELHCTTLSLREKVILLETIQRDLNQTQCHAKEMEHNLQAEKEQISKSTVKQETMQERLAQLHSENMLLRQQLEDVQNKGILKEKAVNETQDRFSEIFSKLRDDTEKKVQMVEDRNKELITKTNDLREQIYKIESEKVEREAELRQVQQELVDALKKKSMSEASLEVTIQKRNDLEEEKLHLLNEIDKLKCKIQDYEERCIHAEHRIQELKTLFGDKEREVLTVSHKLQEFTTVSSGAERTVKQLEEHVQNLEIENARLEAATNQQAVRIEMLQKEQQEAIAVRTRLEDFITNLQSTKIGLEEQLNHQVHQHTILSQTAKDSHNLWEEELRSRSRIGVRLAQLDKEKAELTDQVTGAPPTILSFNICERAPV